MNREVVAFRLDSHRPIERLFERAVRVGRSQCGAQIELFVSAEAGVKLAGSGDPHAVATGAEVFRQRSDQAEPAARFGHIPIPRRTARAMV